jgi:uncharacterized protein (UPF0335 family)
LGGATAPYSTDNQKTQEARRALYDDARGAGIVPSLLRHIIKERRMNPEALAERNVTLDEYRNALGLFASTPLGLAGEARLLTPP